MAQSLQYLLQYLSEGQHRGGRAVFGEKSDAALEGVSHGDFLFFQSRDCAVKEDVNHQRYI